VTPTPSDIDGNFSDRYLQEALRSLAGALKESKKEYHLFVVTSTVSPGTTSANLIPLIEQYSGRKLNFGFGVCYSPEFIALGSVIRDFLNPDLVLIGESDSRAGDLLAGIYEITCENKPYVARMSIVSAEIMKISLNSYITMKISFANTLASICQTVPDADIDAISQALGADKRISPYYIRGGLAYGGPCFPRDNKAFAAFARKFGYDALLAEATDKVNNSQIQHLKDLILEHLPGDKRVSIIGMAYKLNTPVIEESAAMHVIRELLQHDVKISVFDPLAQQNACAAFGDAIDYTTSINECLSSSACWILTLPYPELKDIDVSYITRNPTTIIDCWRIINPVKFGNKVEYIPLGKSSYYAFTTGKGL
jgi:UDPglucose 6-dehydrogenase